MGWGEFALALGALRLTRGAAAPAGPALGGLKVGSKRLLSVGTAKWFEIALHHSLDARAARLRSCDTARRSRAFSGSSSVRCASPDRSSARMSSLTCRSFVPELNGG